MEKLEDAIRAMRRLYHDAIAREIETTSRTYAEIAKQYGVSEQTAYTVARERGSAATASSQTTNLIWPTLVSMPEEEVPMNDYRPPIPEDLNRFNVLTRFLGQVHFEMQNINEETERFITLLDQLGEVLDRHRSDIEDLTSALSDYEDDLERVKSISPSEQSNNQSLGHLARITPDREPRKAEG
jgi:transposase-like protein